VWPSHLGAPLSAAAAAAAVLGLDRERTAHALAIAATRAVGTAGRIAEEPTSRWLSYGCAAADGVVAARAAAAGMAGDLDALAGALPAATGLAVDADLLGEPVGAIARVDVKPFCTARQALAAVEAARLARSALGGDVAEIEVAVPAAYRAMVDQPEPRARLTSIMSAQRQIAVALLDEDRLYDVARDDLSLPAGAEALMRVTRVVEDDALTALYPAVWPARVRLRGAGGEEAERLVGDPLGARERPLGWDDLRRKHTRIGAWGEGLDAALALCRAGLPARELLDLATKDLRQEAVR
jgi:2-methylcitrate dehydratase PrpD